MSKALMSKLLLPSTGRYGQHQEHEMSYRLLKNHRGSYDTSVAVPAVVCRLFRVNLISAVLQHFLPQCYGITAAIQCVTARVESVFVDKWPMLLETLE